MTRLLDRGTAGKSIPARHIYPSSPKDENPALGRHSPGKPDFAALCCGRLLRCVAPKTVGAVVAVVTLAVDLGCAAAAYFLERHVHESEIHTFASALFWTSTQLLTVSSQMKNPLSVGGRVLDVFMEAYAITVVGALAGSFGAFFHRRSAERASR